MMFILGSLDSA